MPDPRLPPYCRLDGADVTLILALADLPAVLYWGPRLPAAADPAALARLHARGPAPGAPDLPPVLALTPTIATGWPGRPGLAAHRDGHGWSSVPRLTDIDTAPGIVTLTSEDPVHAIRLVHCLRLDPAGDILVATTTLTNLGTAPLAVEALAAPVLPLPGFVTRIIDFAGRWAGEFQARTQPRRTGTWTRENRRGRTSHDAFPGLIATETTATESQGLAYGFHLGWSGNHRMAVETLADNRALVMAEPLFLPGEIRLSPGQSLVTPALHAGVATTGLTGLSRAFHRHLRARPAHARLHAAPRRVHFNSWEAVYFDHDPWALADLATRAAAIGAERFVLDDGWFRGRRNDTAGLGDWTVDPVRYPHGLAPLIAHVEALGMDFGLWVEPEMVNPDSDLFRAHPDWVLAAPPEPQLGFRHQLALDFGRADVRTHILAALDALLRAHPIAYLKWDMNRDLGPPGGSDGRAAAHAHVEGVYAVLDSLRAAHPQLEIESCASGGGRADYAILARTDRIWTSDSNDALDRLAIQRGFSHFFPAELMGAHVGPARCHTTGRRLPMALRVATAMFGHMGIEADLRALTPADEATLAAGIALHKVHRPLIHRGDLVRLDSEPGTNAFAIVAPDRSEALVSWTLVTEPEAAWPVALRLAGLDPAADYRLRLVWPPAPGATQGLRDFAASLAAAPLPAALLMHAGFQPPRCHPGTALVLHLARVS